MRYLIGLALLILSIVYSCKDPYLPHVIATNKNYLVVEGVINATPGALTRIRLTRTTNVGDTAMVAAEQQANVTVEQDGTVYPLTESDSGYYEISSLHLTGTTCRLNITTQKNEQYQSDDIPVKSTPLIDSITYAPKDGGVALFVTSHDDMANTRYYRWEFDETWEYHSPYQSTITYDWSKRMLQYKTLAAQDSLYRCFQSQTSTSIEVSSSETLDKDVIYKYPIAFIPAASVRLSVLYSLHIRQYALPKAAYNYFLNLKKTSQNPGDVFGPLPGELKGNIHSLTRKEEVVIGYVTASSITEQRIFLYNDPTFYDWKYSFDYARYAQNAITIEGIDVTLSDQSKYYLENNSPCPLDPAAPPCTSTFGACCTHAIPLHLSGPQLLGYVYDTTCIDCIFWGKGGRKKPDYWPR
ncbi:protein of unknown function [Chitinophaga costaii]|uniref:DUF4249 domain-containing protein n=1 Tax=Chitinophaga costaii TaxID=1335309 RepID=A0A1C4EVX7_9BACT|nr:DUF4249 domain-containing protein [Chitinophaga costaii]PUZ21605.1 DUF4249 domain-containing protein [Chitinophaga costaii]SCC47838.1 protein of unknown function [Chitinophaga costaii]